MVPPQRSPQLLARRLKLLDVRSRRQVRELLDRYEALPTVIEFRDQLQQIWDETAGEPRSGAAGLARAVRPG
jgi:hypothetical protein